MGRQLDLSFIVTMKRPESCWRKCGMIWELGDEPVIEHSFPGRVTVHGLGDVLLCVN